MSLNELKYFIDHRDIKLADNYESLSFPHPTISISDSAGLSYNIVRCASHCVFMSLHLGVFVVNPGRLGGTMAGRRCQTLGSEMSDVSDDVIRHVAIEMVQKRYSIFLMKFFM